MIIEASVRPKNMKRGVSTKSLCQALGFKSEVGLHNLVGKLNLSAEEPGDFGFLLGLYRALSPTGRSKMEKNPKFNGKLLLKVKEEILRRPSMFDMHTWLMGAERFKEKYSCRTVGCIAGWACMLDKSLTEKPRTGSSIQLAAMRSLGISPLEAANLFFTDSWDKGLEQEYDDAETKKERAMVTAKMIDRFYEMKTGRKPPKMKRNRRNKQTQKSWNQVDVLEETPQVERQVRS